MRNLPRLKNCNPLIQIENDDAPKLVIPDTCVDIIYHIDYTNNTVTGGFCGVNDCSFHAHGNRTIGHMVSTFAIRFYSWSAYAFADDSMQCTVNGYFDVGSRFEWLDKIIRPKLLELRTLQEKASFTDQSHLLREFKRYHSMDIHNARMMAFKDVGNIQDVSV